MPERPGLRGALDRIGDGTAAGLVVADLDEASGSNHALAELLGAVRRAGGGHGRARTRRRRPYAERRRVALADAQARIAELRAAGASPRAIADTLNEEGVPDNRLGPAVAAVERARGRRRLAAARSRPPAPASLSAAPRGAKRPCMQGPVTPPAAGARLGLERA